MYFFKASSAPPSVLLCGPSHTLQDTVSRLLLRDDIVGRCGIPLARSLQVEKRDTGGEEKSLLLERIRLPDSDRGQEGAFPVRREIESERWGAKCVCVFCLHARPLFLPLLILHPT